jgi:hypothetical protein
MSDDAVGFQRERRKFAELPDHLVLDRIEQAARGGCVAAVLAQQDGLDEMRPRSIV